MEMISDEIREFVRRSYADEHMDLRELDALADRIDKELVELPRDRGGVPIHIGDTVWDVEDGMEFAVRSITMYAGGAAKVNAFREGCDAHVGPTYFTHTRPDSLERIADELDDFKLGRSLEDLRSIADRIRELTKERGDE